MNKKKRNLFVCLLLMLFLLLCVGISACSNTSQEEDSENQQQIAVESNEELDKNDDAIVDELEKELDDTESDKQVSEESSEKEATGEASEDTEVETDISEEAPEKEDTKTQKEENNSSDSQAEVEQKPDENTEGSSGLGATTEKKEEPHTHKWVEHTETIAHEEIGHYVDVLVKEAWTEEIPIYEYNIPVDICNGCGLDITDNPSKHIKEQALAGNFKCGGHHTDYIDKPTGEVEVIEYPAEYEKQWVVDQEAYNETIVTYSCSCGATK